MDDLDTTGEWERRFSTIEAPLRVAIQVFIDRRRLRGMVDVDDVTQETGLVLWKRRDRFAQGGGQWSAAEESAFLGWAIAIARNLIRNAARSTGRKRPGTRDGALARPLDAELPSPHSGPEEAVLLTEDCDVLRSALAKLNEAHREIVSLVFFDGQRVSDAARTLGISADAARMRVRRAIEHLVYALPIRRG